MTPRAEKALRKSIAHWERVVEHPFSEPVGPEHCALCKEYLSEDCKGCPVAQFTGRGGCQGTPYNGFEAVQVYNDWRARAVATDMLIFLRALLPITGRAEPNMRTKKLP